MKYIYCVRFTGRLRYSQGVTTNLQKTFVFDSPKTYDEIIYQLYETHEHIKIIRITDKRAATAFNEVKP